MGTQFYTCQMVKTLIDATEKVDSDLEKDQECVHGSENQKDADYEQLQRGGRKATLNWKPVTVM